MITCFFSRNSGAIDWAKQQDFKIAAKKSKPGNNTLRGKALEETWLASTVHLHTGIDP